MQAAIVDVLVAKSVAALRSRPGSSGWWSRAASAPTGACASRLASAQAGARGFEVFYPELELCTDNGAMIAFAGALRLAAGPLPATPTGFSVRPRWALDELPAPERKLARRPGQRRGLALLPIRLSFPAMRLCDVGAVAPDQQAAHHDDRERGGSGAVQENCHNGANTAETSAASDE